MKREPEAFALFRSGFARVLDACGLVLIIVLGVQAVFGGSKPFEARALGLGLLGSFACWFAPSARRNLPSSMLAYVSVALLSAAVSRWPHLAVSGEPDWFSLFDRAWYLVIMVVFVFGAAHLLRTPTRLSMFAVLFVLAISVLAVQILFDRSRTGSEYLRYGSASLPTVSQWGGLHQTGALLLLALPFPVVLALLSRSAWQTMSALLLASGLLLVAFVNASRSGMVAMAIVIVVMACALLGQTTLSRRWRPALVVVLAAGAATLLYIIVSGRTSLSPLENYSGNRAPIWRAAARMTMDHPWIGVGPGSYPAAMITEGYASAYLPEYPRNPTGVEQAHNMFLQAAAEVGLPGLVCLLAFWGWMVRACWRAAKTHVPLVAYAVCFALGGFLVRSMSDNLLDGLVSSDRTRVVIWLFFAAALALARLSQTGSELDRSPPGPADGPTPSPFEADRESTPLPRSTAVPTS